MKSDINVLYTKQTKVRPIAIKNIPDHWGVSRAKNVFDAIDERSVSGQEELLSVSHITGVTPRSDKNINMFLAESYEGHKLCKPKDLVVNSLWVWMKALGFSEYEGIVSTAYGVYRLKDESIFNYRYLDYLLRSDFYGGEYLVRSKGIWTSRLLLSDDAFFTIPILVPPRKEQDTIVKFLGEKIADIDKYISTKQKLIDLLSKQKAAIINQAVTKGIDTNAKMKDSGDKYIGKIPVNWEVRKLKFLAEVIFSNVDKHSFEEESKILLCNYVDVYKNDFITSSLDFMKATASKFEIEKFSIKLDDIIVTKDSESYEDIAKPSLVIENLQDIICGYHLAIIRNRSKLITPQFLFYLFKSFDFNKQFATKANGITRYGLSQLEIKDAKILLPSLTEQKEIVSLIEEKSRYIVQQISSIQNQIELIKDYKNSLISEVITGKLKIS